MANNRELELLFADEHIGLEPWIIGNIPKHYKRLSVDEETARRLAIEGQAKLGAAFGVRLFFNQALIAGAVLSPDYDEIVIVTPSQYGKAIADGVPVLTRSGWKKHGDLRIGDEVIAPNGEFVKVQYVHPKCEMDRIVVLENGDEFICHHNHEWVYQSTTGRRKEKCVKTISVEEMERRGIAENDGHRRFVIPVKEPLIGEHKELAVHPYVLGVWLGDGSTTKGQICAHPKDRAVLDRCREYYPGGSEWVHKVSGVITASFNGLSTDLSTYNLCYQRKDTPRKHIPDEYLTASIEQRLELLAGLIDTDGYTYNDERSGSIKARVTFTTAEPWLKDTVEALISTFGWKVSVVQIEPFISSSGIECKHPYWAISFSPTMEIPCVLERKRPKGFSKQKGIGIKEIRHTSGVQGNCITVEGGVYCIGKHLVPTHNSWLMGHLAVYRAYHGAKQYVAGAAANVTQMIMSQTINALGEADDAIKKALLAKASEIERLSTSISKQRLAFRNGGFVEAITLGDSYNDNIMTNKAVGRAGDFIIDEAAMVSEDAFAEMGRREFAKIDGTKYKSILISNPHKPGTFYDKLTESKPSKRTFILWMDSLTAVEEGRFTKEMVFESEFAKHKSTLRRYLLCILDSDGEGAFAVPDVYKAPYKGEYVQYFMGIDSAYKGKDNIEVAVTAVGGGKIHVESVIKVRKPRGKDWQEGKTSEDIIKKIARLARALGVACVCVDTGWGVWLAEGLNRYHVNAIGVNFSESPQRERIKARHYSATNAINKRAEMHLDFQDLSDNGVLEVSEEVYAAIKDVMPYITMERKSNGKMIVRDKSEIKAIIGRSPDEWDSVLLSVQAVIRYLGDAVYAIT